MDIILVRGNLKYVEGIIRHKTKHLIIFCCENIVRKCCWPICMHHLSKSIPFVDECNLKPLQAVRTVDVRCPRLPLIFKRIPTAFLLATSCIEIKARTTKILISIHVTVLK